jgi:hypothetical protein
LILDNVRINRVVDLIVLVIDPFVATVPIPLLIEAEEALEEVQVSVTEPPDAGSVSDDAINVPVGGGKSDNPFPLTNTFFVVAPPPTFVIESEYDCTAVGENLI